MSYDHSPVEALLRPASEYYSGHTAVAAAVLCAFSPSALMMTESVAYASSLVLSLMATKRYYDGAQIHRYQQNLRRLKRFEMASRKVPWSNKQLYVGKGFVWEPLHTQRYIDAMGVLGREFRGQPKMAKQARKLEIAIEHNRLFSPLAKLTSADHWWNPARPLPPVGGNSVLHGVEPNEEDVYFNLGERVGHMLVLGTTRVGKTRLAEIIISQDIARGDGPVVVIDPKGDADLMLRMYTEAKRAGRENEFNVFHLGYPDISARYNSIGNFSRISEVATRTTNQLSAEGNSAAFKEFSWRFVNILSQALVQLDRRPDYTALTRYMMDMEPLFIETSEKYLMQHASDKWAAEVRYIEENMKTVPRHLQGRSKRVAALETYLTRNKLYDPVVNGLLSAIRYDRTYFDKLTASFLPLMEKLTSGRMQELVAPNYDDIDDERPILDWMTIIRKRQIVYVGLAAMSDMDVATAVGNSMFADLVSTAGALYLQSEHRGLADDLRKNTTTPIYLHADEFSDLCGEEFKPLLNKAGGAGIRVAAYSQTRADLETAFGSQAKGRVIEGNFNTLIMLRVKSKDTAEIMTDQLGECSINQITMVSGVNDTAETDDGIHFTSKNEDRLTSQRVPILESDMLINLPKGQAFALIEGSKLYKLRFPLLHDAPEDIPPPLTTLAQQMSQEYKTSDKWWSS